MTNGEGNRTAPPLRPRSILVYVWVDLLGDGLIKLPFARGLRQAFPDAKITWVAGKDTSVYAGALKPLVDGVIDEVIERADFGLHPKELLRRPLGGRQFDLVIDTQRVAMTTCLVWRVPHRWFLSGMGRFVLSSRRPAPGYRTPRSMLRRLLDLLELAVGQPVPTPAAIDVPIGAEFAAAAAGLLPDGPVYVGLAPGAGGRFKCWPLERYAALGQMQAERGRVPVFLLGPQELEWVATLRQAVPSALFPLQADGVAERFKYAPLLTMALGGRLSACISNDSGLGHMLAASGRPLVSLFGPTDPRKFPPATLRGTILQAQDWGGGAMEAIPLAAVAEAVEAALLDVAGLADGGIGRREAGQ